VFNKLHPIGGKKKTHTKCKHFQFQSSTLSQFIATAHNWQFCSVQYFTGRSTQYRIQHRTFYWTCTTYFLCVPTLIWHESYAVHISQNNCSLPSKSLHYNCYTEANTNNSCSLLEWFIHFQVPNCPWWVPITVSILHGLNNCHHYSLTHYLFSTP
jgi:hypothetical protein